MHPSRLYRTKTMEFNDFPKLVKTPARPTRREIHFENLIEKAPSRRQKPKFFDYFSESSASPRRGAKNGAKIASRRLPRSLWGSPGEPPGSQHRSTFRLLGAPRGPDIIFFGPPRGNLRSPVPAPGRSRSPPEAIFKPPNTKIFKTNSFE